MVKENYEATLNYIRELLNQNKRNRQEKKIRESLSKNTLFTSVARWFNNK